MQTEPATPTVPTRVPRADLWATDHALHLVVDLPGVVADDLDVRVEHNMLFVEATRRDAAGTADRRFRRAVALRGRIDAEQIHAALRDGVLTVELPRVGTDRPRQVPVVEARGHAAR
jgi:HSP20 family protein